MASFASAAPVPSKGDLVTSIGQLTSVFETKGRTRIKRVRGKRRGGKGGHYVGGE